jgi:hypothetical protein
MEAECCIHNKSEREREREREGEREFPGQPGLLHRENLSQKKKKRKKKRKEKRKKKGKEAMEQGGSSKGKAAFYLFVKKYLFFISFIFRSIIIIFCLPLSSLQTFPHVPPCSLSNSWPLFFN